jgi:hypothetical protein
MRHYSLVPAEHLEKFGQPISDPSGRPVRELDLERSIDLADSDLLPLAMFHGHLFADVMSNQGDDRDVLEIIDAFLAPASFFVVHVQQRTGAYQPTSGGAGG